MPESTKCIDARSKSEGSLIEKHQFDPSRIPSDVKTKNVPNRKGTTMPRMKSTVPIFKYNTIIRKTRYRYVESSHHILPPDEDAPLMYSRCQISRHPRSKVPLSLNILFEQMKDKFDF
jgi:hypothetical protein